MAGCSAGSNDVVRDMKVFLFVVSGTTAYQAQTELQTLKSASPTVCNGHADEHAFESCR